MNKTALPKVPMEKFLMNREKDRTGNLSGATNAIPRILVLGPNPAWQKVIHFSTLKLGEVNRAGKLEAFASGKGINFCRAARCWGSAETALLQFAGGENGKLLNTYLRNENLLPLTISTTAPTRCCMTCIAEADGSITELIEPSFPPGDAATAAALATLKEELGGVQALALCGTLPDGMQIDFYVQAVQAAAAANVPVLIDSYRKIEPVLRAAQRAILKINAAELATLSGIPDDIPAGMRLLREQYQLEAVAITNGAHASYFANAQGLWRYAPVKLETVVNTIGCGDTASAVFLSEIVNGTAPEKAFAAALGAASANCLTPLCGNFDPADARRITDQIAVENLQN